MVSLAHPLQWILASLLIISALGVILVSSPVYASLCFMATLFVLSAFYLELSAEFIAVMQILVYAGAILVIFMFVLVLFQDAHQQIVNYEPRSSVPFLAVASFGLLGSLGFVAYHLAGYDLTKKAVPEGFGSAESLGNALYVDYFFPFETVILLFLVAVIGAVYIGKKRIG